MFFIVLRYENCQIGYKYLYVYTCYIYISYQQLLYEHQLNLNQVDSVGSSSPCGGASPCGAAVFCFIIIVLVCMCENE